MVNVKPSDDIHSASSPTQFFNQYLEGILTACVAWLLLVGLWSGPAYGASLVYRNGLLPVEIVLTVTIVLLAFRGRIRSLRDYPFFWPCLAVVGLSTFAAICRITLRGTATGDEELLLWRQGEPMLRGVLLFLAIVGRPKIIRVAWIALLIGLALQVCAAVVQHFTHISRWYADLDRGWATGWSPVYGPVSTADSPAPAPRVQGLTSYINLTAAMLAASLPFWALPPIFRIPQAAMGRVVMIVGGLVTAAGLFYTNSRGPIMAVALVMVLLCLRPALPWKVSSLTAIAACGLAIWSESKRLALAMFISAIVLATLFKRRHVRYLLPVIFALGLAGGIQAFDAYVLHYQLSWRISDQGLGDEARVMLYKNAVRTIGESPLWGVGDAGVAQRVTHLPIPVLQHLPRTQQNYHDQYLHWAAAEGLPVGIALAMLVCWTVIWCWRRSVCQDPFARMLALAAASGMTIFLICNLVDAHFWRIEGGGFFWSLVAVTAAVGISLEAPSNHDKPIE
ncbi:MAG TPA: O-antigen ligase family protein [Armatimonadota bacterium]|nr:O-antigen ligase family protein [Armatimonadota bacterium]